MEKIIIKVVGFGETRFMEAILLEGTGRLVVDGFAAKLGRGAKVHGASYTFRLGHVNADGAYVANSRAATVLNRTGWIIGFWDDAKHNQYASNHINYRRQRENNAPAPTLEQIWNLDNLQQEAVIAENVKRFNLQPIAAVA